MTRVRTNATYTYNPVGLDLWHVNRCGLTAGDRVKVVNLPGCPPCNTMGMAHVNDAATGEFRGLVLTASLNR